MSHAQEAKRWRALAAEALVRARDMKDPDAKAIMIGIAERYDRLAQQAERRAGPEDSN